MKLKWMILNRRNVIYKILKYIWLKFVNLFINNSIYVSHKNAISINFCLFPTRALNSTINNTYWRHCTCQLKSCRRQRQIKKNTQQARKYKKILWHEARKHVGWRWRQLRRITTSMTALLSERVVIVLLYPYRATPHNPTPHHSEPRRVASRRAAIFLPSAPHFWSLS